MKKNNEIIKEINWTNTPDIDPEGIWDVEAQEFIPDFRKFLLKSIAEEIERMEFPTILGVTVDYDGAMISAREFYSLGVVASAEEAKKATVGIIEDAYRIAGERNFDAPDVHIKPLPVKGKGFIGYTEYWD